MLGGHTPFAIPIYCRDVWENERDPTGHNEGAVPMTIIELCGMSVLDWLITHYRDHRRLTWGPYESPLVRWHEERVDVCFGRYEYVFIVPIALQRNRTFMRLINVGVDEAMGEFVRILEL